MKEILKRYLKVYLGIHLVFLLLAMLVYRRAQVVYPFVRLELGAILISLFVTLSIGMFRFEKGNGILNTIAGYLLLIPGIFILRETFGNYLFRFSWLIYLFMVGVGIIYGVSVFVVSRKYKKEVQDLNQLLEETSPKE
ncbi:MAG: hypothetical protein Q8M70_07605 [bacterium]|nr:hypothetical protein [bacterium]